MRLDDDITGVDCIGLDDNDITGVICVLGWIIMASQE